MTEINQLPCDKKDTRSVVGSMSQTVEIDEEGYCCLIEEEIDTILQEETKEYIEQFPVEKREKEVCSLTRSRASRASRQNQEDSFREEVYSETRPQRCPTSLYAVSNKRRLSSFL